MIKSVRSGIVSAIVIIGLLGTCKNDPGLLSNVDCMIGTDGDANLLPVVSVPFGMVQLGADTHLNNSGYKYDAHEIIGFSHTHISGGGCIEYKDIMFFPQSDTAWAKRTIFPGRVAEPFSHDHEKAEPGYYTVDLLNSKIKVELTATSRCGMHRYSFPKGKPQQLIIDLKYGTDIGCTVCPEYNFDTVRVAGIQIIDDKTIQGYRVSDGWFHGVHVNFYAEFSKPFKSVKLYSDKKLVDNASELTGRDIRALIEFETKESDELDIRVGISPVDTEGAHKNLKSEIQTWNFQKIKELAQNKWEKELSVFQVADAVNSHKSLFYTMLYRSLFLSTTLF